LVVAFKTVFFVLELPTPHFWHQFLFKRQELLVKVYILAVVGLENYQTLLM